MAVIGHFNSLEIVSEVNFGVYLNGAEHGEILLPLKYLKGTEKIGDIIDVFIYTDSEDRLIATTEIPKAVLGEFAYLKVVSVNEIGAFLDWGLEKDLLVPFREQNKRLEEGQSYVVKVLFDSNTERLFASSRLDRFLDKEPVDYQQGQKVEILVAKKTDLGYKAIVNNINWGILYENEIFKTIELGMCYTAYINKVRDDNKIDLSLYQPGYDKIDGVAKKILDKINEHGGKININDKSDAETIYNLYGESKKTFKKAVGSLYKQRLIKFDDDGISLI